jgi:acetyl-CoA carboxylase, biotin carboxylase subunit
MHFDKVLIANRGEIACRVIRACRQLGIKTVAVYSEADAAAPHVKLADTAVLIGPPPAIQSYLNQDAVFEAARATHVDAIHPGYGFLSENAGFAERCAERGLVFVGPPPSAISSMGDKINSRRLAVEAGMPVVPGTPDAVAGDADPRAVAAGIGYPLLVKASAGGGGIGMTIARDEAQLEAAVRTSRSRAGRAFGDDAVFFERFVDQPRHVEVQLFGDQAGALVHLFERECSVQRRYQKVIEEAPSPAVSPTLRARLTDAALNVARRVGYTNAGTIECMVDAERNFYFLEMNTRLQVEHPITEAITGRDLVQAQLKVAMGEPLPWQQSEIELRGHAIECRVYAEHPETFMPSPGHISRYVEPGLPDVRVDSGVAEGSDVTVFYDPLLAKVIAWGETRPLAIERMFEALSAFEIEGVRTNIPLHLRVLRHAGFHSGEYDTSVLESVSHQ